MNKIYRINFSIFFTAYCDIKYGGAKEDRTPDLLRARQALSQLSYGPILVVGFLRPPSKKLNVH